jgi:hypothetical protein
VQAITVRSSKDIKVVQTFSFAPAIQARAQQMIRAGAFQSGTRVTVVFQPGTNVAIRIKG